MAVYTQLSNETIAELVEKTYDIGQFAFAVGIAQGVENTNYLVATMRDGVEEKHILTLYEKRVKESDLPFFIGLLTHMHAKGIPCPLPIARRDGTVVGTVQGKQAALATFLHGQSRTIIHNAHAAEVGAMAARMHEAAKDYKGTRENALSLFGWEQIFVKVGSRLNEIQDGLANIVAGEIAYLNRHWPKGLPSGVVHADMFPDNVFFEGDTLTGVIDFYFGCNDAFAYDLMIVMNAWCFDKKEFNFTKAKLLLSNYQKVRVLSDEEKKALPVLARGAALRFLLTRAHDKIFHDANALVTPHDPMEYVRKLQFHQTVKDAAELGL